MGDRSTQQDTEHPGACEPATEAEAAGACSLTTASIAVGMVINNSHATPTCDAPMTTALDLPGEPAPGTTLLIKAVTPSPHAEQTPTPREVAWCLAKFASDVQQKRPMPLIASSPKQKPPVKKMNVLLRNRRIAAQQMVHILVSKRGEVLAMRKMGFTHPNA